MDVKDGWMDGWMDRVEICKGMRKIQLEVHILCKYCVNEVGGSRSSGGLLIFCTLKVGEFLLLGVVFLHF